MVLILLDFLIQGLELLTRLTPFHYTYSNGHFFISLSIQREKSEFRLIVLMIEAGRARIIESGTVVAPY